MEKECRLYFHGHRGRIVGDAGTHWRIYWYGGKEGAEHAQRIRSLGLPPTHVHKDAVEILIERPTVIRTWYPPCIVVAPTSGKTYACGGEVIQIPGDMTLQEVRAIWVRSWEPPKREDQVSKLKKVKVKSNRTNEVYTVTLAPHGNSCDCAGFGFRGKCSHITKALAEN